MYVYARLNKTKKNKGEREEERKKERKIASRCKIFLQPWKLVL